jgi:hypothetical protein
MGQSKKLMTTTKKIEYGRHLELINMDHISIIALLGNILWLILISFSCGEHCFYFVWNFFQCVNLKKKKENILMYK